MTHLYWLNLESKQGKKEGLIKKIKPEEPRINYYSIYFIFHWVITSRIWI